MGFAHFPNHWKVLLRFERSSIPTTGYSHGNAIGTNIWCHWRCNLRWFTNRLSPQLSLSMQSIWSSLVATHALQISGHCFDSKATLCLILCGIVFHIFGALFNFIASCNSMDCIFWDGSIFRCFTLIAFVFIKTYNRSFGFCTTMEVGRTALGCDTTAWLSSLDHRSIYL